MTDRRAVIDSETMCRRCGHTKDEHWYSGFVCNTCGCTLFKPVVGGGDD